MKKERRFGLSSRQASLHAEQTFSSLKGTIRKGTFVRSSDQVDLVTWFDSFTVLPYQLESLHWEHTFKSQGSMANTCSRLQRLLLQVNISSRVPKTARFSRFWSLAVQRKKVIDFIGPMSTNSWIWLCQVVWSPWMRPHAYSHVSINMYTYQRRIRDKIHLIVGLNQLYATARIVILILVRM